MEVGVLDDAKAVPEGIARLPEYGCLAYHNCILYGLSVTGSVLRVVQHDQDELVSRQQFWIQLNSVSLPVVSREHLLSEGGFCYALLQGVRSGILSEFGIHLEW